MRRIIVTLTITVGLVTAFAAGAAAYPYEEACTTYGGGGYASAKVSQFKGMELRADATINIVGTCTTRKGATKVFVIHVPNDFEDYFSQQADFYYAVASQHP